MFFTFGHQIAEIVARTLYDYRYMKEPEYVDVSTEQKSHVPANIKHLVRDQFHLRLRLDGLAVSVSASHVVGCGFAP